MFILFSLMKTKKINNPLVCGRGPPFEQPHGDTHINRLCVPCLLQRSSVRASVRPAGFDRFEPIYRAAAAGAG